LWHSKFRRIQHSVGLAYFIALLAELFDKFLKESPVLTNGEPLNVFEHKILRLKIANQPQKVEDQSISGIFHTSLPDETETLTWGTTENHIDFGAAYRGIVPDVIAVNIRNATANGRTSGKVVSVSAAMDRIVFNGSAHVESGPFESQAQAPGACKKVYSNWSQ
jgi:hypothetical protein